MKHRALIFIIGCFVLLIGIAIYYQELYQEDSYTHYLMARYAPRHLWIFWNIWGRPIPTAILSITAGLGLFPTKVLTIFISLFCAFLTYKIARREKIKNAEYTILFVVFQPYYLLLSINPLTEIFFATILTLSLLCLLHKNYLLSTIFASVMPLARPEGFFFLILWAIILIRAKKCKLIPLLGIGVIFWDFLGFLQSGDFIWLYNNFPWFAERGFYGSGGFCHLLFSMPEITGLLCPLFILGIIALILKGRWEFPVIFLYFLLLHSILWTFGLFRSSGYTRYFVSIAPIIGIISVYGLNVLFNFFNLPKFLIPAYTVIFCLLSFFKIFVIQPPTVDTDHLLIKSAYEYYQRYLPKEAPVICASNYFFYLSNNDRFRYDKFPFPNRKNLKNSPQNTVAIWDSKFFAKECGIEKKEIEGLGYKRLKSYANLNPFYELTIFIKP